ncbi:MAG: energy transducer TonB [Bryobacterales bacterium]|nr:energy transducer TonB [Bryobacterales bacterium]
MLYPAVLLFAAVAFGQVTIIQTPLTPEDVANLEGAVRTNPDARAPRTRLLQHYLTVAPGHPDRVPHVLYWIEKFPDDPLFANPMLQITAAQNPHGHEMLRQVWARVAAGSNTPMVLVSAARFLQTDHPEEAERLLADGVLRLPEERMVATNLGFLYALNVLGLRNAAGGVRPDSADTRALAEHARAALDASRNPFVLGAAGVALPNLFPTTRAARESNGDRSVFDLSARLMARARELAPHDTEFRGPMPLIREFQSFRSAQHVGTLEFRMEPPRPAPAVPPNRIRVGAAVMAAKLMSKPEAVYPEVARQARIQGVVRFTGMIAKDGAVDNLQLVAGHPVLVPAAVEAVRQYRYERTLLNGEPVEVVTEIEVTFTLQR